MPDIVKFIFLGVVGGGGGGKDVFFHTYKEPGNKL